MSKKLLRIYLKSITVKSNGDLPPELNPSKKDKERKKENAIVATLRYPRPGAPNVVTSFPLALENNTELPFPKNDFFKNGLFKEDVLDETILHVRVTDRDETSKLGKVLTKIFATLLGAGLGAATAGVSNVLLGAIVKLGIATGTGAIEASSDAKIEIIGEAERRLNMDSVPSELKLNLKAPATIKKRFFAFEKVGSSKVVEREITLTTKGRNNGQVVLQLTADDVP